MNNTNTLSSIGRSATLAFMMGLAVINSAQAGGNNDIWIGNTDGNLATAANWSGNAVPAAGDYLFFGAAGTSGTTLNNNLVAGTSFAGITFNSGGSAYTIVGNTIGLAGGITNNSGSAQVINNAIGLNANANLSDGGGGMTLGGLISGAFGLTNVGAGSVFLSYDNNSFTGGVTVNNGVLMVGPSPSDGGGSSLGKEASTIVNAGGTLVGTGTDAFGYGAIGAHNNPSNIVVNGGVVTEVATSDYHITMPNLVFTGGTLTNPPGNTGSTQGDYEMNGDAGPCTITGNAAATTAVLCPLYMNLNRQVTFNVAAGNVTGGPTPGVDMLVTATITGAAANPIIKAGPGVLEFTGASTFSGQLEINGGAFMLAGNASLRPMTISVSNGATFDVSQLSVTPFTAEEPFAGSGGVRGPFAIGTSGSIGVGQYSVSSSALTGAGTLAFSNSLTLNGDNTLNFIMSGSPQGSNSQIVVGGNLTVNGANTIALQGPAVYGAGTYTLITYATETNGPSGNWTLSGFPAGQLPNAAIVDTGSGQINLVVSNTPVALLWVGDGVTNNWDTVSSNWSNGTNLTTYTDGDPVTFNDSGSANPPVNMAGTVQPGGIVVSNTGSVNYTFAGAGAISGITGLVKQGSASLTLTETGGDNFTGGITVNGGMVVLDDTGMISGGATIAADASLQIGNNDSYGTLPAGTTLMNGALSFNQAGGYALVTNVISGTNTGSLSINDGDYVSFTAANTYTGNIYVNNGTLEFAVSAANAGTSGGLGASLAPGRVIYVGPLGTLSGGTPSAGNNWFGDEQVPDSDLPSFIINGGTVNGLRYTTIGSLALSNGATLSDSPTGGSVASYRGFQFRGSITVGGANASTIFSGNGYGDDLSTNTIFNVSVTSNSPPDLIVNAPLEDQSLDFGSAPGGFTKTGPGTMLIEAACTFTGPTTVGSGVLQINDQGSITTSTNIILDAGAIIDVSPRSDTDDALTLAGGETLNGTGTILGNLIVDTNAVVAPGIGNSYGVLTVTNGVTLQGATIVKINPAAGTNDEIIGAQSITYGGTLLVTNLGGMPGAGQTFQLFNAASSNYSGSFASVQLPPLDPFLAWQNNLSVSGSLSVLAVVPQIPAINAVARSGTNLVFSGTNGPAATTYYVLASTNLSLPLANWTVIATNTFDSSGNFSVTNPIVGGGPPTFFVLSIP